jgi:hypothetical protein
LEEIASTPTACAWAASAADSRRLLWPTWTITGIRPAAAATNASVNSRRSPEVRLLPSPVLPAT